MTDVANAACLACLACCATCLILLRCAANPTPALYVRAIWGIGNRLRTLRVAYDLARELGRPLVLVDELDEFCSLRLSDLLHLPVARVLTHRRLVPRCAVRLRYNTPAGCGLQLPLDAFRAIPGDILIEACHLRVDGLADSSAFYRHVRPKQRLRDALAPLSARLQDCVGVHIRQGSIADYRKGNFFGAWDNSSRKDPVGCCVAGSETPSLCPSSAPKLDVFVDGMRRYPGDTAFFVASDRPGCIQRLHAEFPGRILHLPVRVERELDTFRGMCDFLALSACRELLVTRVSSFSDEAAAVRGIPRVKL